MSKGFHDSGFHSVGAVDLERGKPGRAGKSKGSTTACNSTFKRNIGFEPLKADITRLDPDDYRGFVGLEPGELTVLISCAPCTGFSQKNAQNHIEDDPRNQLVARSALFVKAFMPEFFVMENVKELLRGRHTHHFEELATILKSLNYSIEAEIVNFAHFGLPQNRIRSIVIARRDRGMIPKIPRNLRRMYTVRDAIEELPTLDQGEIHSMDPMHRCPIHTDPVTQRMKAIPRDGGSWGDIKETHPHLLIPSMLRKNRRPGSFPDVYGRMWWDRAAPTITRECGSPGNGRFTHPEQDRMLSVREMALLQGFPPEYYFEGKLNQKYNQIGDAVPPLVSRQIAEHLLSIRSNTAKQAGTQFSLFAGVE